MRRRAGSPDRFLALILVGLVSLLSCLLSPLKAAIGPGIPTFQEHTLATDLRGGYQVVAVDLNKDGRPDLIALASGMSELVWFENPGWQRHVIISHVSRMINLAAWDVDGDGIPEIALATEFSNDPAQSPGILSILKHKGDPREPWTSMEIDRLPASHRLRWADLDGTGRKSLINAPLAGPQARPPDYRDGVSLVRYQPGSWKREPITPALEGVLHGILVFDWDHNGRDEILAASFLGIDLFRLQKNGAWERRHLSSGNSDPWPKSGTSDVAVGTLGKQRFLCSIEPWHGNQVAVYRQDGEKWARQVIDTSLVDGHTISTADLNADGRDEIIAGFRGTGRSVYFYSADDGDGRHWTRHALDDGGISAASCAVADLNGDGRPDVACIGMATSNLKWYENTTPR